MFRPLVRKKQKLSNEVCIALLQSAPRGVLSLMGDNGYPYGVPMDHWYCPEDGRIYFHSGKTGHKIDAMTRCEKASYCVMDDGVRQEGSWYLNFQSVIVFGRIEIVEDHDTAMEICRKLSRKYTDDEDYIANEIKHFGSGTLCFRLVPEHISGKTVQES